MTNTKEIFKALLESVLDSANVTDEEIVIKNLREELVGKTEKSNPKSKNNEEKDAKDVSENDSPKYFTLSKSEYEEIYAGSWQQYH